MKIDEPILVQLFFDREERAITETKAKYGAYCNRIAYDILRDAQDAAECENDAYLQLWRLIPPKRPLCFRTFLGRIVRNLSVNRLNQRSCQKRGGINGEILGEINQMLKTNRSPEEEVMGAEMQRAIVRFLDQQSYRSRVMFAQRYWYLKEIPDIAALHGCSEEAVRSSLYRTRTALKEFLTKEGYL